MTQSSDEFIREIIVRDISDGVLSNDIELYIHMYRTQCILFSDTNIVDVFISCRYAILHHNYHPFEPVEYGSQFGLVYSKFRGYGPKYGKLTLKRYIRFIYGYYAVSISSKSISDLTLPNGVAKLIMEDINNGIPSHDINNILKIYVNLINTQLQLSQAVDERYLYRAISLFYLMTIYQYELPYMVSRTLRTKSLISGTIKINLTDKVTEEESYYRRLSFKRKLNVTDLVNKFGKSLVTRRLDIKYY